MNVNYERMHFEFGLMGFSLCYPRYLIVSGGVWMNALTRSQGLRKQYDNFFAWKCPPFSLKCLIKTPEIEMIFSDTQNHVRFRVQEEISVLCNTTLIFHHQTFFSLLPFLRACRPGYIFMDVRCVGLNSAPVPSGPVLDAMEGGKSFNSSPTPRLVDATSRPPVSRAFAS